MKNKKKTYLLLALVLFIWGLAIYQFFSFTGQNVEENTAIINPSIKPLAVKERQKFYINVNYRDPFLGKMYIPANGASKKAVSKKKIAFKEPIVWPGIIYRGIVSDTKDRKKVFMVVINGRTFLMHEKETENDVSLKKGNRDFIEVIYKGNFNKILIQQ